MNHSGPPVVPQGVPVLLVLALLLVCPLPALAQEAAVAEEPRAAEQTSLAHVRVVATGGTIAGRAASPEQISNYRSGAIPVEDLLRDLPGLDAVARVSAEQFSNVGSTGISPGDWLRLAQRINAILADGVDGDAVDGVVVTHGTDALEETAYFLNLTVRSDKPVVLVGSMRPATAISADGPLNILNATQVAADPRSRGRGVLVVLNQQIDAARDVTKTSALRVETFRSRVWGALGTVDPDGVHFARRTEKRHTHLGEFDVSSLTEEDLPRVDIAYSYNGADGAAVHAFVAAGARGIVIAGSGAGATSRELGRAAFEAAETGVFLVRSSRTGSGRLSGGRGTMIGGDDLLAQKARILLMVALAHTDDPGEIQRIFREY